MNTEITHIILAIILFLVQNWIGGKSYGKGYVRFSLLDDVDESISFNFLLKVFGPIVYLIIISATLQYFSLGEIVVGINHVVYYYLIIRILIIFAFERHTIVNWPRIIIHYASILIISNLLYNKLISSVEYLLPDFTEIKNEVWLCILVFVYQIGNRNEEYIPNPLYVSEQAFLPEFKPRKQKYVKKVYASFIKKYGTCISEISKNNRSFEVIIYAILIFENFNRPRIIRLIERIIVRFSKSARTQGVMQVLSKTGISDFESVDIGAKRLYQRYQEFKAKDDNYHASYTYRRLIKRHCPDKKYIRQVLFIAKYLIEQESNKKEFEEIMKEIIYEFGLYDFYD